MLSPSHQNDEKRQGPVQPWPSHGPTSFPCYYTSNGFVLHYTNVFIAHWFFFPITPSLVLKIVPPAISNHHPLREKSLFTYMGKELIIDDT